MLEYVDKLPDVERAATPTSYVADDVEEFIRSGKDVALVSYEGKRPQTVNQTLRNYVESRGITDVSVVMRGGEVYLTRP